MKNLLVVTRAFILGVLLAGASSSIAVWSADVMRKKTLNAFTSQMIQEATDLQDQIDDLSAKMKAQSAELEKLRAKK